MAAAAAELQRGLSGLLGEPIKSASAVRKHAVVIGTPANSPLIAALNIQARLRPLGDEGYLIERTRIKGKPVILIAANSDIGVLYGSFHFYACCKPNSLLSLLPSAAALNCAIE